MVHLVGRVAMAAFLWHPLRAPLEALTAAVGPIRLASRQLKHSRQPIHEEMVDCLLVMEAAVVAALTVVALETATPTPLLVEAVEKAAVALSELSGEREGVSQIMPYKGVLHA